MLIERVSEIGSVKYQKAFGKTGVEAGAKPMQLDSMVWIASCTKVCTSQPLCELFCWLRKCLDVDQTFFSLVADFDLRNAMC